MLPLTQSLPSRKRVGRGAQGAGRGRSQDCPAPARTTRGRKLLPAARTAGRRAGKGPCLGPLGPATTQRRPYEAEEPRGLTPKGATPSAVPQQQPRASVAFQGTQADSRRKVHPWEREWGFPVRRTVNSSSSGVVGVARKGLGWQLPKGLWLTTAGNRMLG